MDGKGIDDDENMGDSIFVMLSFMGACGVEIATLWSMTTLKLFLGTLRIHDTDCSLIIVVFAVTAAAGSDWCRSHSDFAKPFRKDGEGV